MAPLLEIDDLRVSFRTEGGRVNAVNGISYAVQEGEIVGVVGESGSGKSVHALSIIQLVPRAAGRIEGGQVRFGDRDMLALSPRQMRRVRGRQIAMIFQDPISSLNPVYTIGFQLREVLKRHLGLDASRANRRAAELLSLVGIADARQRLDVYPHQLSGGMRQRVMIAMAVACNPSLLIADEPTTALDVTIQSEVLALLRALQRETGTALLLITHDFGVVAETSSRVMVMKHGRIADGFVSMSKLRAHPIIGARDYYYSYVIYHEELRENAGAGYFARLSDCFTVPRIRRANYGASTVMLAQQMCGINSMSEPFLSVIKLLY